MVPETSSYPRSTVSCFLGFIRKKYFSNLYSTFPYSIPCMAYSSQRKYLWLISLTINRGQSFWVGPNCYSIAYMPDNKIYGLWTKHLIFILEPYTKRMLRRNVTFCCIPVVNFYTPWLNTDKKIASVWFKLSFLFPFSYLSYARRQPKRYLLLS